MRLKLYTVGIFVISICNLFCQDSIRNINSISKPKGIVQEDVGVGLNMGDSKRENNFVYYVDGVKMTGEIYGKVKDEKDEAIPFAQIIVIEDYEGLKPTSKGTKANMQGEFTLKGLAPGSYNILIKALGRERYIELKVKVTQGNRTELNAVLIKNSRSCYTKNYCCCGLSSRNLNKKMEKAMVENKELLLSFYPNPSVGYLYVETPKNAYLLEIFDINGKLIYKNDLKETTPKIEIDLHAFQNGIYFINCSASGNKKFFEKFELWK